MKDFLKNWLFPVVILVCMAIIAVKCEYQETERQKELRNLKQQRYDD